MSWRFLHKQPLQPLLWHLSSLNAMCHAFLIADVWQPVDSTCVVVLLVNFIFFYWRIDHYQEIRKVQLIRGCFHSLSGQAFFSPPSISTLPHPSPPTFLETKWWQIQEWSLWLVRWGTNKLKPVKSTLSRANTDNS